MWNRMPPVANKLIRGIKYSMSPSKLMNDKFDKPLGGFVASVDQPVDSTTAGPVHGPVFRLQCGNVSQNRIGHQGPRVQVTVQQIIHHSVRRPRGHHENSQVENPRLDHHRPAAGARIQKNHNMDRLVNFIFFAHSPALVLW